MCRALISTICRRWIRPSCQEPPKIYFDSEDAVLSESGDILIPLEQGIITKDALHRRPGSGDQRRNSGKRE